MHYESDRSPPSRFFALMSISLVLSFLAPPPAWSSSSKANVEQIRKRLDRSGADAVNSYLSAHWVTEMGRLLEDVEACRPEAVALSLRLLETTNVEALAAHRYSLELAMERCPAEVLSRASVAQVPMLCAIDAHMEKFPDADPLLAIEQRTAGLRGIPHAVPEPNLRACLKAYEGVRQVYLREDH